MVVVIGTGSFSAAAAAVTSLVPLGPSAVMVLVVLLLGLWLVVPRSRLFCAWALMLLSVSAVSRGGGLMPLCQC